MAKNKIIAKSKLKKILIKEIGEATREMVYWSRECVKAADLEDYARLCLSNVRLRERRYERLAEELKALIRAEKYAGLE